MKEFGHKDLRRAGSRNNVFSADRWHTPDVGDGWWVMGDGCLDERDQTPPPGFLWFFFSAGLGCQGCLGYPLLFEKALGLHSG